MQLLNIHMYKYKLKLLKLPYLEHHTIDNKAGKMDGKRLYNPMYGVY